MNDNLIAGTYMCVVLPDGSKTTMGLIDMQDGIQVVVVAGRIYSLNDMLRIGYRFYHILPLTPEVVVHLDTLIAFAKHDLGEGILRNHVLTKAAVAAIQPIIQGLEGYTE